MYVVGAANSAGQAVLNLARFAKRVVLLVRGPSLEASMSKYLVDRIEDHPGIQVRLRTEVTACRGDGHLQSLVLHDKANDVHDEVDADWLFAFIGAAPRTDWLGKEVVRDGNGFVVTGPDLAEDWAQPRPPFVLETSVPGVFAAGDVRLDSMKRVASAVGEGAMAVHLVHRYLATV